ncbi:MAG: VOC family protein [Planctomycetes bacterium]|nr:VOC family protein [Planctomycetota bacterium]
MPDRTDRSPPPVEAVIETAIYASDLGAAESFYAGVLGLPVIGREAGRHVFFRVGSAGVLLVFNPDATLAGGALPPHGARGAGHFALGVPAESLGTWRDHLVARGAAIEKEADWPLGGRSLYFRDPAGNSVELVTPGVWGTPAGW